MKEISQNGIDMIKGFESFRSNPYLCPAGVPTIGYGATYYQNGKRVTLQDNPITEQVANDLLKFMLGKYEDAVNRYVQEEINQNQFDALVSFTYNVGMESLRISTLLRVLNNNPNNEEIRTQFMRWTKANGRVLEGLKRRRKKEADLYFS
jgi:lysozyme